jgi:hypothetical protein
MHYLTFVITSTNRQKELHEQLISFDINSDIEFDDKCIGYNPKSVWDIYQIGGSFDQLLKNNCQRKGDIDIINGIKTKPFEIKFNSKKIKFNFCKSIEEIDKVIEYNNSKIIPDYINYMIRDGFCSIFNKETDFTPASSYGSCERVELDEPEIFMYPDFVVFDKCFYTKERKIFENEFESKMTEYKYIWNSIPDNYFVWNIDLHR